MPHSRRRRIGLAALGAAAVMHPLAEPAHAQEVLILENVVSDGEFGSPANTVIRRAFQGGYALGRIDFVGELTAVHRRTWASDARILITAPSGAQTVVQPFTSARFTKLPVDHAVVIEPGVDPEGEWTFRFYEFFDDGRPGEIDALWDLRITMNPDPLPPPPHAGLGPIEPPGLPTLRPALAPQQVLWYRFELPVEVSALLGTYLDIDTHGSELTAPGLGFNLNDTQLALFDAFGTLIASDSDSGDGFTSQLTFGAGTRPAKGSGKPYDGRHGDLGPGTYYLAVVGYECRFGPGPWSAQPGSALEGVAAISIAHDSGCYPDCDGNAVLDFFDFLCFQNAFIAQDPYADCDGNGTLDFFDFLCFQNAFLAGCP